MCVQFRQKRKPLHFLATNSAVVEGKAMDGVHKTLNGFVTLSNDTFFQPFVTFVKEATMHVILVWKYLENLLRYFLID